MNGETALDFGVVLYAILATMFMIVLAVLFVVRCKDPLVRVHNPPMLILMSVGAAFHIVAEVVANRHIVFFKTVEVLACPLWGYWIPYVLGAGFFFTGLYIRLFTYTTAVSREFNSRGAARARQWRWPVALLTLFPIACIAVLVTTTPGATHVDNDSGTCESERGYKIAVGAWMSACILALLTSVAIFRHGYVADIVGEVRKQVFVGTMGIVVLGAVAFVMLFAEEGLEDVANRFVATFSITTLYLWALGVLGARPLWKVLRGDASYRRVHDEQLETISQPLDSVVAILKRAKDADAARTLFADFIAYCSLTSTPLMDRGRGKTTAPQDVAMFYAQMDYWTSCKIAASAFADHEVNMNDWPPLVCSDIVRTKDEIITRYFTRVCVPGFVDVGMDTAARDSTTQNNVSEDIPVNLFKYAMWWAVGLLDEFYGEIYLKKDICGRDIFTSAQNPSVRTMIANLRRSEARNRMADAQLTVVTAGADDDALVAVVQNSASESDSPVVVLDGSTTEPSTSEEEEDRSPV